MLIFVGCVALIVGVAAGWAAAQVAGIGESADELSKVVTELERAYRCVRGFYYFAQKDQKPDKNFMAYNSATIGAAMRFVHEKALDGAAYFEGKPIAVLHDALKL